MKLGIGSYTYPYSIAGSHGSRQRLNAKELLNRAYELGVHVVQFCDNLPLTRLTEEELQEVETLAKQWGIEVELGTRGLADRKGLLDHLRLAQRLGAPFVRVVVDGAGSEPSAEECVVWLREVLPAFKEAGVKLALENHDRFTSRTLVSMIEKTEPAWVGICLDTVNSLGALEGPEWVVAMLAPYTLNLHLKDFRIERVPNQLGFNIRGCPLGQGRLDVPWVLEQLQKAGKDLNAIIELWTCVEEEDCDVWALEESWARASVEYARRWIPE